MPRIEKLVQVDGRLGVVLDVPPSPKEGDSVTILTADELREMTNSAYEAAAKECEELAETWAKKEDEEFALHRAAMEIRKLKINT